MAEDVDIREYQGNSIGLAIKNAKKLLNDKKLSFDPQGRVLIDLTVTSAKKTLCSIDVCDDEQLKTAFLQSLGQGYEAKLQALLESDARGSVISLYEEVMMHSYLALNLIDKALEGTSNPQLTDVQISQVKQTLSAEISCKVNDEFRSALDAAYDQGKDVIRIDKLNKVLGCVDNQ